MNSARVISMRSLHRASNTSSGTYSFLEAAAPQRWKSETDGWKGFKWYSGFLRERLATTSRAFVLASTLRIPPVSKANAIPICPSAFPLHRATLRSARFSRPPIDPSFKYGRESARWQRMEPQFRDRASGVLHGTAARFIGVERVYADTADSQSSLASIFGFLQRLHPCLWQPRVCRGNGSSLPQFSCTGPVRLFKSPRVKLDLHEPVPRRSSQCTVLDVSRVLARIFISSLPGTTILTRYVLSTTVSSTSRPVDGEGISLAFLWWTKIEGSLGTLHMRSA